MARWSTARWGMLAGLVLGAALTAAPLRAQEAASVTAYPDAARLVDGETRMQLLAGPAGWALREAAGRRTPLSFAEPPLRWATDPEGRMAAFLHAGERTTLRLSVQALGGSLRYEAVLPRTPDAPHPLIAVAADGRAVVVDPATTRLTVFDAAGAVVAERVLVADAVWTVERNVAMALAPDGAFAAVALVPAPLRPDAPRPPAELVLIGLDGTERARRPLALPDVQALALAPDGQTVLVATYDGYAPGGPRLATTLLDADGTARARLEGGFTAATFTGGEAVLATRDAARVIDLRDGQQRQRYDAPAGRLVLDAQLADDGTLLVLEGAARFREGRFVYEALAVATRAPDGAAARQMLAATSAVPPRLAAADAEAVTLLLDAGTLRLDRPRP